MTYFQQLTDRERRWVTDQAKAILSNPDIDPDDLDEEEIGQTGEYRPLDIFADEELALIIEELARNVIEQRDQIPIDELEDMTFQRQPQ